VAQQFTIEEGREKYLKAAKDFRMPFWGRSISRYYLNCLLIGMRKDWARPGLPAFPEEATDSDKASVILPQSLLQEYPDLKRIADGFVEIHNPLYSYPFPSDVDNEFKVRKFPSSFYFFYPSSIDC
jgi:hypothetical protein